MTMPNQRHGPAEGSALDPLAKEPVRVPDRLRASLFDESWQRQWKAPRMKLMCKNPTTLFVYWELTDWQRNLVAQHFQSQWHKLPFFLSVYDVTNVIFNGYNAHSVRTLAVHPDAQNWYIHSLNPGRRYLVTFGTTTVRGDFFAIVQSNTVQMPLLGGADSLHGGDASNPQVTFSKPFSRRLEPVDLVAPDLSEWLLTEDPSDSVDGVATGTAQYSEGTDDWVGSGHSVFPGGKGEQTS